MADDTPAPHAGMRHIALCVNRLEDCMRFYTNLLGMAVEWHPDVDNVYLTSGNDNLALHRRTEDELSPTQRLDHIGFVINDIDDVDVWHAHLAANDVKISKTPKTHRDGARSFYCEDPDGTQIQMIFHPPISRPGTGKNVKPDK